MQHGRRSLVAIMRQRTGGRGRLRQGKRELILAPAAMRLVGREERHVRGQKRPIRRCHIRCVSTNDSPSGIS